MAESLPAFVQRRRAGWEELKALLDRLEAREVQLDELDRVDRLYRRAASDLAQARTFFPTSDATVYLNQLCARGYGLIYQRRTARAAAVKRFFLNDFPGVFWAERRYFFIALGLLVAGALIGTVAAISEPSAMEALIPEGIREHVKSGTLWTDEVLSFATPSVVGANIATNNMTVAITAFALGLTAGLGTAVVVFFNGLHIGAVLALTFSADLGWRLLGFMVAHGFVELASILIAGQAGFILGDALINPGMLTRGAALRVRGRRAVRLVMGTLPVFVVLGLIEGFVSPGQEFPWQLKLALGLSILGLFFGYLVRFGRAAKLEGELAADQRG